MKRFLKRSAFTIIEMVIVIAVIGILATVMIPTISGMIEKANKSADTQFAASLTIQLAMESVDGGINSEEDLREAFKEFYDEDYYDTKLMPKAAKSGYHFWYNVVDGSVVAGTYNDIVAMAGPETAGPARGDFNFETANPRTVVTENGNCFFLMDCGGDFVNEVIKGLDKMTDVGTYAAILDMLKAPNFNEADNALCAQLLLELESIAIVNDAGTFAQGGKAISHIYIPRTASELGDKLMLTGEGNISLNAQKFAIQVPAGVKIGSYSMNGFLRVEGENNPYLEGSTELHMNIDANQLKDFFGSEATNCVIVLPNGDRYIQVDGGFQKLTENGAVDVEGQETEYSKNIETFDVGMTGGEDDGGYKKADLDFNKNNAEGNVLYIVKGYTGNITLGANNFVAEGGSSITPSKVIWMKGGESLGDTAEVTVSAADLIGDGDITVQAQGKNYSINVVTVEVSSIDLFKFENSDTEKEGEGAAYKPVLLLSYSTEKTSWSLPVTANLSAGSDRGLYIDMTVSVTDPNGYLTYDNTNNQLVLTEKGKALSGGADAYYITVTCGGASRQCKVTLEDNNKPAFEVNNGVYALDKYKNFVFTFGTEGGVTTLKLNELFKFAEDVSLAGNTPITVNISTQGSENLTASEFDTKTYTLSDFNNGEVTFTLTCRGQNLPVTINIAKDAYNVTTAEQWKAVPDSKSIVLLKDITFPDVEVSAMSTSSGNYSKNIGGATVYGNLHRINFGKFLIKVKGNNYFLRMGNNSKLKDLIINGPAYNTRQDTQSTNGYFVSGIETTSTSNIDNCYISGFRTGIYAQGTTNISNTVINGGALANINIHGSITINFTNVETYQYAQSNVKIGAGIFIDNNDKASTDVTMTANNLRQYNFYTEAQIKEIANSLATGAGSAISFSNFSSLLKDGYYHAGILAWNEKSSLTTKVNSGNGVNGYGSGTYTKNLYIAYRDATIFGRGENCPAAPVTSYSIDNDFLYSKYTDAYKATLTQ